MTVGKYEEKNTVKRSTLRCFDAGTFFLRIINNSRGKLKWKSQLRPRIRFHAKTETFLFVFAFRPHANAYSAFSKVSVFTENVFRKRVRKWRLSKTLRCRVDGRKRRLLKTVLIWKRIRVDVAWDVFWYRGKGHSQIKPQFYLDFLFINTDSFQKPYKELRIRSSLLHFPWFKNFNAKRIC